MNINNHKLKKVHTMKKPNITPGDWHQVKQQDSGDIYILSKQALATGAASVCQVPRIRAEFGANAQAIAALPKLLEALEQLEAIGSGGVAMRHETGKPTWSALDEVKRITREALAAAGYTE